MQIVCGYLLLMNLLGFVLMAVDKAKARRGARRIRERTLFLAALLGGSIGSLLGMFCCRHKTKHVSFLVGMPLILLVQIALIAVLHLL